MFEEKKAAWLQKAEELKPELIRETVRPVSGMPGRALTENESIVLDFGNHYVGRLTLKLGSEGSHPDAPAWLQVKFCENSRELDETLDGYTGWISRGWVQQEQVHIDVLPSELALPRRYAFRYVRIDVLALSSRYRLVVEDAFAETVTSADDRVIRPLEGDTRDMAIDRAALRTLHNCMQDVFEDGPKRDRRLWLGDLRLQALANGVTYRNFSLVKRCLYLFACAADTEGRITRKAAFPRACLPSRAWKATIPTCSIIRCSLSRHCCSMSGQAATGRRWRTCCRWPCTSSAFRKNSLTRIPG